jgi:secondary thiamine-phosphate synthase enzyme
MRIITESITKHTQGNTDIVNITPEVQLLVERSGFVEGNATVFVVGSTASISTIEYEQGLKRDLPEVLDKLISSKQTYHHDETWGDHNGHSHLRSTIFGCSQVIPFVKSKLMLGTWQQIVLIDFDDRPRTRNIVVQIIGK